MTGTKSASGRAAAFLLGLVLLLSAGPAGAGDAIDGTVVSVQGDAVVIQLSSQGRPAAGDKVELIYVTSSGMELPVGTWKVQSVSGSTVTAGHVSSSASARKGLKARIHTQQKTQVRQEKPKKPQSASASTASSAAAAKSQAQTKSVTLLGESPVASAAEIFERGQDYYFARKGYSRNYQKAVELFRQGAEKGHAHSQNFLGSCYRFGHGLPKDDKLAARWFRKAADQGLDGAQYNLAVLHANGHGVAKNLSEARKLFRLSADQGYAKAQHNLAIMYRNGLGMPKDERMAAAWLHKAANQNLSPSQYELGTMYEKGLGVPQSDSLALSWYRKAAAAGYERAQEILKRKGVGW